MIGILNMNISALENFEDDIAGDILEIITVFSAWP